jgi:hypothetical protein
MKNIIVFILALSIGFQHCLKMSVFVWYSLNKKVIVQKLCINKNNPQLRCEGKCYLGKQLKKAEEGESKAAKILHEKHDFIPQLFSDFNLHFPSKLIKKLFYPFTQHIPSSPVFDIIHPPG